MRLQLSKYVACTCSIDYNIGDFDRSQHCHRLKYLRDKRHKQPLLLSYSRVGAVPFTVDNSKMEQCISPEL